MIDMGVMFELAKATTRAPFDTLLHTPQDFENASDRMWNGRVWADLTLFTYSTGNTLETLLTLVFTRFQKQEFFEGFFVIKAQFGADWLVPVLQHPHCVLRQSASERQLFLEPHLHSNSLSLCSGFKRPAGCTDTIITPATSPKKRFQSNRLRDSTFEPLIIFYLGPNVHEFCSSFYTVGLIPGINSWSAVMTPEDPIEIIQKEHSQKTPLNEMNQKELNQRMKLDTQLHGLLVDPSPLLSPEMLNSPLITPGMMQSPLLSSGTLTGLFNYP